MGWTEGVLAIALVVLRLYGLIIEQFRNYLRGLEGKRSATEWMRFLLLSALGAWLLLATASFLAAVGGGGFRAGFRVGVVLWLSEMLVHARELVGFVRKLRAGAPVTPEETFSLSAAAWTSTVIAIPVGALVGHWLA
ncbi:MAG: hypothetical protein Q8Q09_19500 [Deltaproteobacteria bacterium]|nr:hypothetical protein [Deltaproteobacteria bacterium]